MRFFASESSSLSISRISGSDSSSSIIRLSSTVCLQFLYSRYASAMGCRSLCSFISFWKRAVSFATVGSFNSFKISSRRIKISSNLSNMVFLLFLSSHIRSQKPGLLPASDIPLPHGKSFCKNTGHPLSRQGPFSAHGPSLPPSDCL